MKLCYVVNQYMSVIPGLPIGHRLLSIPCVIRVITSSLANFYFTTEAAAGSLAAAKVYAFFRIVLPNIKLGIACGCIMAIVNSFNNVSLSAFLTGPGMSMLPIEIMNCVEYHFDRAIAALVTIPTLVDLGVMLLIERTLDLESVEYLNRLWSVLLLWLLKDRAGAYSVSARRRRGAAGRTHCRRM